MRHERQPVEFDPRKDSDNLKKHGISLRYGEELQWDLALAKPDPQWQEEERMVALVPDEARVYFVSYIDKGHVLRIISIRRADRKESLHYVQSFS